MWKKKSISHKKYFVTSLYRLTSENFNFTKFLRSKHVSKTIISILCGSLYCIYNNFVSPWENTFFVHECKSILLKTSTSICITFLWKMCRKCFFVWVDFLIFLWEQKNLFGKSHPPFFIKRPLKFSWPLLELPNSTYYWPLFSRIGSKSIKNLVSWKIRLPTFLQTNNFGKLFFDFCTVQPELKLTNFNYRNTPKFFSQGFGYGVGRIRYDNCGLIHC